MLKETAVTSAEYRVFRVNLKSAREEHKMGIKGIHSIMKKVFDPSSKRAGPIGMAIIIKTTNTNPIAFIPSLRINKIDTNVSRAKKAIIHAVLELVKNKIPNINKNASELNILANQVFEVKIITPIIGNSADRSAPK